MTETNQQIFEEMAASLEEIDLDNYGESIADSLDYDENYHDLNPNFQTSDKLPFNDDEMEDLGI